MGMPSQLQSSNPGGGSSPLSDEVSSDAEVLLSDDVSPGDVVEDAGEGLGPAVVGEPEVAGLPLVDPLVVPSWLSIAGPQATSRSTNAEVEDR